MNDSILSCSKVTKIFGDGNKTSTILHDINITVKPAEIISIVGSSGTGKSTLLHILGGLEQASAGELVLNGINYTNSDEQTKAYLRNKYLGFVYQFHHLLPEFTALENVAMPLLLTGTATMRSIITKTTALLTKVGLSKRLHHKPAQLSGGERQRVAIARAIINEPLCILADEPTGNLDPDNAQNIMALLLELQEHSGMSMIIATHDYQLANMAQRIFSIHHHQLVPLGANLSNYANSSGSTSRE